MRKLDNIHIDFSTIDGREKRLNAIITARDDGKTTGFLMRKFLPSWRKTKSPLVLLFRNIADVKPSSLQYYANLMNEFLDVPIVLKVSETSCKEGITTAYHGIDPIFHAVALSVKEATLKKTAFPRVKFVLFDELEINPKNDEKYLKNEYGKFQAYFGTQLKLTPEVKFYGLTNPYSRVNPYFQAWGVNVRDLNLGTLQTGADWAVWFKRMNPLLVEQLKKKNPLYSEESEYKRMALGGEMVNDDLSHVRPMSPRGNYHLDLLFVHGSRKYGVYKSGEFFDETIPLYYIKKEDHSSRRRTIYAFSFGDLICNSVIASKDDRTSFAHLKQAIRAQDVDFDDVETQNDFQEIFDYL